MQLANHACLHPALPPLTNSSQSCLGLFSLRVVSSFCEWSGMTVKLQKSVITAFDFGARCKLPTDTTHYQGQPLVRLAAEQSFPYLGV